jgi:hypothetical protein
VAGSTDLNDGLPDALIGRKNLKQNSALRTTLAEAKQALCGPIHVVNRKISPQNKNRNTDTIDQPIFS